MSFTANSARLFSDASAISAETKSALRQPSLIRHSVSSSLNFGKYFVINKKDGVFSDISISGGTFVNFNPAASVENPEQNFVANGYKAVQIEGTNNYKVEAV